MEDIGPVATMIIWREIKKLETKEEEMSLKEKIKRAHYDQKKKKKEGMKM